MNETLGYKPKLLVDCDISSYIDKQSNLIPDLYSQYYFFLNYFLEIVLT